MLDLPRPTARAAAVTDSAIGSVGVALLLSLTGRFRLIGDEIIIRRIPKALETTDRRSHATARNSAPA